MLSVLVYTEVAEHPLTALILLLLFVVTFGSLCFNVCSSLISQLFKIYVNHKQSSVMALVMRCATVCWLALLFLRNTELQQVINLTGYCSTCSHQKLINVHSYLLPSWKLSVAAVITFYECAMTSCGLPFAGSRCFHEPFVGTTYPAVLVSEGETSSASEAASIQLTTPDLNCFTAHQCEGCDKSLESMACPPAGGWLWKK